MRPQGIGPAKRDLSPGLGSPDVSGLGRDAHSHARLRAVSQLGWVVAARWAATRTANGDAFHRLSLQSDTSKPVRAIGPADELESDLDSCKNKFRRGGVIATLFSGTPPGCDRRRAACPVVPPRRDHRLLSTNPPGWGTPVPIRNREPGGRSPFTLNDHRLSRQGGTNPPGWRKSEFVFAQALRLKK